MKIYTQKEIISALKKVGLTRGDIVYIHSRLFTLGKMKEGNTKEELCKRILDAFFEVISDDGTLVVPAFTTQTQRYGMPFILEETECMTGIFSEYIRCRPDSVRSLHPINSVTAIGKRKFEICKDTSASNYGIDSPFDRMLQMEAKAVNLGMDIYSNSWAHYLEAVYGVPHVYNKLLDVAVYEKGKRVDKSFFGNLRYLDFNISNNYKYFDSVLIERNLLKIERIGNGDVSCISSVTYMQVGLELLKKDPYAFLDAPPSFRPGEKPFDGITRGRDEQSEQQAYAFLADREQNTTLF